MLRPIAPTAVVAVEAVAALRARWETASPRDRRPPAHEAGHRLAAAVGDRARLARTPDARPARRAAGSGAGCYGAAAYAAADALRARPHDEAVELSVRLLVDGGRLTVARRTQGSHTVAIEAQIA